MAAASLQRANRQFNTFRGVTGQPSASDPAVQTLEDCPLYWTPTDAEPILECGCATGPKGKPPSPLVGDCQDS